jgi:hypothetical protein
VLGLAGSANERCDPAGGRLFARVVRGVWIAEVANYVFGDYTGEWPSPPHADGNPKQAIIISWSDFPFRFVFAHEGSYCPWFEFPSGAGHCFQFFEGNDGWAELFNDFGRLETNSFVTIMDRNPERARHVVPIDSPPDRKRLETTGRFPGRRPCDSFA